MRRLVAVSAIASGSLGATGGESVLAENQSDQGSVRYDKCNELSYEVETGESLFGISSKFETQIENAIFKQKL